MAKRPVRKKGESVKEYRARVSKWEARQAGNFVKGAASAVGNFLMSKPKVGEDKNRNLTAWRRNDASGTSSITGKKTDKKKTKTTSKEKQGPPQSDTYKVSGITYNRATGRPVKVDKGYEPVKAGTKRGGGPAPAPQKSARQKEIESIRKDKSLSDMDKFVKANRKMIESVGTKRQREMLADYDKRHKPKSDTVKPDTSKVKGSNFGKKTGVDTSKYAPKNKERYDTSKVGGKFKKDLGIETGKYRVKSGSPKPKKRDTSKVKGSNFGKDSGVDTKDYELPNKNRNATLKFGTKVKGVDTEKYEVKNKKNFADKLKKVTGKFIRK